MMLLVIVSSILCFVYAWRRRQKYLEGKWPPICSSAWPIIGHFSLWVRGLFWDRLLDMQKDCLEKGCVTYLYSGTNPSYTFYGLCDPKDCTVVINECHEKTFTLEDSMKAVFGEGLAVAPVQVWEKHRELLEPVFEQMCSLESINFYAEDLVHKISEKSGKGLFDQTAYLRDTTMNILFSIILGIGKEYDSRDIHLKSYKTALQKISEVLFERYQSFFMHKKFFFRCSTLKRRQDQCVREIKNITKEIITTRRDELKNIRTDNVIEITRNPLSLLDVLLKLESDGILSEEQVIDEVNMAMFSGYEALVNSLTFALVVLRSYPEVQDKVYLEIKDMLTSMKLDTKLEYLEAVIMETLRLYPTVSLVSRVINKTTEIKNYSLDCRAQCLLFIHAMNRHHSWGEDREVFRPERWLEGSALPECATFGLGKRSCVGKHIALNTIKIILLHLLREYKITSDYTKMVITQRILLTPKTGHYISLERRISDTEIITMA